MPFKYPDMVLGYFPDLTNFPMEARGGATSDNINEHDNNRTKVWKCIFSVDETIYMSQGGRNKVFKTYIWHFNRLYRSNSSDSHKYFIHNSWQRKDFLQV